MGARSVQPAVHEDDTTWTESGEHESLAVAPDAVEVRRSAAVAAGVGLTASAVAIAYLGRATQTGSVLDWAFVVAMGLLGAYWLVSLVDARTPLLVADAQGIRIRLGRTWRGLPWTAVHHVEHTPRQGLLRDGRLVVVPHNLELIEAELTGAGKRHTSISRLLHGAPFAVPLGLSTRVIGADGDLTEALGRVARDASQIVVLEPTPEVEDSESDEAAEPVDAPEAAEAPEGPEASVSSEPEVVVPVVVASPTPVALRETGAARRSEVRRDVVVDEDEPEGRELRRPGRVSLVEETQSWGDRVRAIARPGDPVEPLVLDDFEVEPAEDPVIGPELAAARTRLGLSVDQLADRTRIRPHVIEAVEVDDFEPCGGDFYARGHLRTLARVLGIDVAPLLASYDERYARAPINPRRVFEAELATGAHGSIRGTRGRPQLVGARRRRHGPRARLVDRPAGHGHPARAARRHTGPQRLRRSAGRRHGPVGRAGGGRRQRGVGRRPGRRTGRRGGAGLQGQPRRGPDPRAQGLAPGARDVLRRCRHRLAGRRRRPPGRRARRRGSGHLRHRLSRPSPTS